MHDDFTGRAKIVGRPSDRLVAVTLNDAEALRLRMTRAHFVGQAGLFAATNDRDATVPFPSKDPQRDPLRERRVFAIDAADPGIVAPR